MISYITSLPCPPRKAKLSGGFRFLQQAVGISPASLKRTDARKISTVEIFPLMRYNAFAFQAAQGNGRLRPKARARIPRHNFDDVLCFHSKVDFTPQNL
jgi:hypothetical protein